MIFVVLGFVFSAYFGLIPRVSAEQLGSRSLRTESSIPSAVTRHSFTFSYGASGDSIASIMFEYCTSPLVQIVCSAPTGMDATTATLTSQTGETGFSIFDQQPNRIILARAAAQPPIVNPSSYVFDAITNPSTIGAFYVRISTYTTTDGTGPYTDFGAVAGSTTQSVLISSEVPPILKFCVGITLGNDCTTADDNFVDLGDMSVSRASRGSSQMIAATNAEFGLAIAAYGTTMTSGNNVIPALSSPTVSAPGNAQFGFNLRDNSDPDIGEEPNGLGISNPVAPYNIQNRYVFNSGDVVATSPAATDSRKFTSSYIVNISPSQPPGVYTATLTYICTATF
ncbi:MAG: hypothetical protein ABWX94_02170 [Candidatus Saccharimonadales bacterium]